ncbi:hypothetical protein A3I27_00320 [Candidatus Giovannonibacteria bacterium RIFCSPLOWO2_02_FULL_43_11b]|uniref:phenylalanine--tRNA ligase n=1 Tax=Candidatus Giovannonibacteria bacterium RIFCSPHIGHO2_12_FULL_43_15 TaxID=1798341 RepID=A0A1F5WNG0_9BACT|nr:MAG: hypothetical protein A2739_02490 [Candidatus Giovannonibacteria bacterium RIFCSPHIGHO2_01_FULL_43_100]OGF65906.1 MAG: hypothetical protein A3B97_02805 [Candidatus Giovannonibacteria bacterium RIFCSPHIGHO2_02_FULL_43_32]OGF77193.1 MAG: hypothetical protein A3F23_01470 [Candidatus Giovannonibacteria bacterium RIFCSPHIGHO2_12_FULL_43_15]OGF78612.1 MAG: hypothetical protein A3A15_03050 [Candidatus Giovannonibacteria bacterium RIFCSPLOWO2_01_FULL_43_60]OGF90438.1 MAG: hypothetical protein A3
MQIKIESPEEKELLKSLAAKQDPESKRMVRFLNMPDLSRTPESPLYVLVESALKIKNLKDFDVIEIPEIVPVDVSFDLFDFAPDHPVRSKSDTYYADEKNILRTHDTVMWYYYLKHPATKEKIEKKETLGVICYGKVFRKDEIDRKHMNIFHQFGGLYLQPDIKGVMPVEKLKEVLHEIVETLFGKDTKYRFLDDIFPYTDPSLQIEVKVGNNWVEIMGGGMPKKSVLKKMGLEGYNGWAFGFGLERLAIISMELPDIRLLWSADERVKKQLKLGNKFKEVSKFPPITRDISFVVPNSFIPNNYFDLIRDLGGDIVEEVKLIDKYENKEKFGADKVSYTYRIIYRSNDRTLTNEEVDAIQKKVYGETAKQFGAELR